MRLRRTGQAAKSADFRQPGTPELSHNLVPVCYPALAFLTVKTAEKVNPDLLFALRNACREDCRNAAGSLANSSRTAYNRAVLNKSLIRLFLLALQRHRARVRLHTWRALFLPGITSAAWLALLLPGTSAPSSVYVKVCKNFGTEALPEPPEAVAWCLPCDIIDGRDSGHDTKAAPHQAVARSGFDERMR